MPFLTLEDPNAKIKGSRDPLGVQPIWASFARHVITNLTTQTSSVRGFTILLLGRYFAAQLVEDGIVPREKALDVFLRMEQIGAYVRHAGHGVEEGIRGIERVTKYLEETNGRPYIEADRRGMILSDQKIYGLWGLYTVSARTSGLLPDGPVGISQIARDFVERSYIPTLAPVRKPLLGLLSKGGRLETRGAKDPVFAALAKILQEKFTNEESIFYGTYIRDGVATSNGQPGQQARFRQLLSEHSDIRSINGGQRPELLGVLKRARKVDEVLARKVERMVHLESLLAPAGALFDFVLMRNAQRPKDLHAALRERWGKSVPNLEPKAYEDIRSELRSATSAEIETAAGKCHAALRLGNYAEAVNAVLDWNRQVMIRRQAGPWATLTSNGLIDVRLPAVEYPIPTEKEMPTLWRNSYFIDSLKSITRQLANSR